MPFSINPSERNLGLSEMSDDRRKQLRIQRRISAKLRVMRRVDEFIARQREDQRMIADQLRLLRATNEKREHSSLQNCSLEQEQPMNQQCQQGVEEERVPLNEHTRLRLSDIRIQSDTEDSSSSSHNDSQENSGEPKRRWKEMIAENGVSERELKRLRSARNISDFDGGNHRLLLLAEAGAELLLELERSKRGPVSNDRDHNQEATPTLQSMPEKIQCGSVRNDQDHDREGTPSLQNMHEKSQCGLVRNDHDHHHQEVTPSLQNMPEKSQCGSVGNDQDQRQEGALSSQNMPENSQHGSVRNDQDHHREGSSSIQNILEKSQHGSARNDRDHHQGGAPSLQNMPEKSQHGSVRNDQDHHQDVEQSIQNMPEKTHCGLAINDQDHDGSMRLENTCMHANSTDQARVDHQLLAINTVHNSDAGNSNLRIRGRIRLSDIKRLARLGNARPIGDINVVRVQEQVLHSSERDNHNAPRVVEHAPCSHNDVAMKCTEQKQAIGQDHNNPPSVTMDNDIAMEHTEQQKQELDHVRERVNRQGEEAYHNNPPSVTTDHDACTHNDVAMEHTEQQKQELDHVRERVNQQGDEDQNNTPSVTTNHDACTHNDVAMEHTEQHKQEMDNVRDRVNWQGDEDDHNVPSAKCASDNFHAPSLVSKHVEQVQQEKDSKDHNSPPSVTTNHDACAHNDVAMEHIEQQKQDMDHVREQVNRQGDEVATGNHNVLSAICSSNNFHAPSLVTKHLEQVQQGSKVPTNGLNSQILEGMNTKQACRGMDYKHAADDHNSPSVEKHDACSHNDVAMKRTEQQQQEMGKDNHNPLSVTTDHNACTRNDVAMEHTKRQKQEMDHVREQINLQIDEVPAGNHNVLSTKCASDNFHAPSLTTFMNHDARTHIDVAMEHTKRQKQEMDHVREQIYLQSDEADNHNVLSANCASDNFHGPSFTTKQAEQVQQEKGSQVSTNDLNSQILEGMNMEQAWRDMEHKHAAGERWQQGIVITQLQERNREDQDLRVQQHQPEITNELIQLPGVQIMQEPSAPPCCCTIAQEGAAPPYCCTILQWHTAPHLTEDQLREHQRSIAREKRLERTNKLRNPQRNPASVAEQQLEELKTTRQGRVFNIARQQRLEKRREQRKRLEAARQQRNLMIDQQRDKQFELENNPHQSIENNQYPEDQYHVKQLDAALLEGNAEVITDNLRVQGKTRLIQIRRQARLVYEEQIESQSDKDDGRTQAVEAMNEETMHGEIKCQSDAGQSSQQPCHSSSEESQEMKLCRLAFEHQQTQQLRMRIIRRCMAVSQQTVLTSPEHKQKLRELQSIIARQKKLIRINNWRKQERGRQSNAVRKQRHQMTDEQREKIREAQRQWLLRRAHVVREQCLLAAEQRQEQRIEEVNASLNLLEHLSGSDAGRTHNLLVQLEGRYNFHQTIENDQSLQGQQSMEELNSTRVNINIEVENGRTRLNQIRHQARVRYTHSLEIDVGHSHEQLTLQNNERGKNICQPIVPRDELLREYACRGSTSDRA